MFKYIISAAVFYASAVASEDVALQSSDNVVTVQTVSESIELIIKDLEYGITLLDAISDTSNFLYTVDDITQQQLIKFIALVNMKENNKLDPILAEKLDLILIAKLAKTFRIFHDKLVAVFPFHKSHISPAPEENDSVVTVD